MKTLLLSIFILTSCYASAQNASTHSVFFDLNQHELSEKEKRKFNRWISEFKDTLKRIEIVGFADYLNSEEYNLLLSEKRANSVVSILESKEGFRYTMSLVSAKGEENSKPTNDAEIGNPSDRRVDITVYPKEKRTKSETINQVKQDPKPIDNEADLLVRASIGQTIVLKNLNFFPGRHYLIPKAIPELDRLAQTLIQNPVMEIEIHGHICCKLDSIDAKDIDTQTYSLSLNRAKYIHDQLVLAGVDSTRMSYRGFAGSRPLYNPEITATHRNRNRRVEIKVINK